MSVPPRNPIYTANPKAGYLAYKTETIQSVLSASQYILGPAVEHFEAAFARFTGVEHGVGVNAAPMRFISPLSGSVSGRVMKSSLFPILRSPP